MQKKWQIVTLSVTTLLTSAMSLSAAEQGVEKRKGRDFYDSFVNAEDRGILLFPPHYNNSNAFAKLLCDSTADDLLTNTTNPNGTNLDGHIFYNIEKIRGKSPNFFNAEEKELTLGLRSVTFDIQYQAQVLGELLHDAARFGGPSYVAISKNEMKGKFTSEGNWKFSLVSPIPFPMMGLGHGGEEPRFYSTQEGKPLLHISAYWGMKFSDFRDKFSAASEEKIAALKTENSRKTYTTAIETLGVESYSVSWEKGEPFVFSFRILVHGVTGVLSKKYGYDVIFVDVSYSAEEMNALLGSFVPANMEERLQHHYRPADLDN